jgi:hypothetical protein
MTVGAWARRVRPVPRSSPSSRPSSPEQRSAAQRPSSPEHRSGLRAVHVRGQGRSGAGCQGARGSAHRSRRRWAHPLCAVRAGHPSALGPRPRHSWPMAARRAARDAPRDAPLRHLRWAAQFREHTRSSLGQGRQLEMGAHEAARDGAQPAGPCVMRAPAPARRQRRQLALPPSLSIPSPAHLYTRTLHTAPVWAGRTRGPLEALLLTAGTQLSALSSL